MPRFLVHFRKLYVQDVPLVLMYTESFSISTRVCKYPETGVGVSIFVGAWGGISHAGNGFGDLVTKRRAVEMASIL